MSVRDTPRRIAVTMGDPAGIGPELLARLIPERPVEPGRGVLFVDRDRLHASADQLGIDRIDSRGWQVEHVAVDGPVTVGRPDANSGRAAARCLEAAVRAVGEGRADAIVTAPLHKGALHAAGIPHPGHTEYLSALTRSDETAMLFVGGGLKVALLTIHCSLVDAARSLRRDAVVRKLRLLDREHRRWFGSPPRIALAGLNPHAGEDGLFGDEDRRELRPAVEIARREGLDVAGPLPADTLFVRQQRGEFDLSLACYHDQGLIPVKLAAFGRAVNVTLGLPFLRTSVDHGTACDIAGQGRADVGSLLEAYDLAVELAAAPAPA